MWSLLRIHQLFSSGLENRCLLRLPLEISFLPILALAIFVTKLIIGFPLFTLWKNTKIFPASGDKLWNFFYHKIFIYLWFEKRFLFDKHFINYCIIKKNVSQWRIQYINFFFCFNHYRVATGCIARWCAYASSYFIAVIFMIENLFYYTVTPWFEINIAHIHPGQNSKEHDFLLRSVSYRNG